MHGIRIVFRVQGHLFGERIAPDFLAVALVGAHEKQQGSGDRVGCVFCMQDVHHDDLLPISNKLGKFPAAIPAGGVSCA